MAHRSNLFHLRRVGLLGAKKRRRSKIQSEVWNRFDSDDPGFLLPKAPPANHMGNPDSRIGIACRRRARRRYFGDPRWAAEGIAAMTLGRHRRQTTANIGQIEGGMATKIIPNLVVLKGEARSHQRRETRCSTQHMTNARGAAAKYEVTVAGKTTKASVSGISTRVLVHGRGGQLALVQLCSKPLRNGPRCEDNGLGRRL